MTSQIYAHFDYIIESECMRRVICFYETKKRFIL